MSSLANVAAVLLLSLGTKAVNEANVAEVVTAGGATADAGAISALVEKINADSVSGLLNAGRAKFASISVGGGGAAAAPAAGGAAAGGAPAAAAAAAPAEEEEETTDFGMDLF